MEKRGQDVTALPDEAVVLRATGYSQATQDPLPTLGKMILHDGQTGERFDQPVTVGMIYMLKLAHLVEDKVHTRSTGAYSLVTQQPLGGRRSSAASASARWKSGRWKPTARLTLQEMLTIKSDDVPGRVKAYESIVQGLPIERGGDPASFKVLVNGATEPGRYTLEADHRSPRGTCLGLWARERSGGSGSSRVLGLTD